jgi:glutaredoxin
MSAAARFSYTSRATLWPNLGRDDWTGLTTYGPPQVFACDYSAESLRMVDAKGVEFTTRQILFTELSTAKQGDMVLIGESAVASPVAAGALEVRAVTRFADTFRNEADDYKLMS